MSNNTNRAFLLLCVLGAATQVLACDEECVDGVCVPVYDTGYYYDNLVSGVAYSTQTEDGTIRTGVTGENGDPGSFSYYMPEATMTFSLGDTALGQSPAQARVTPFDIAGVTEEPVGGCDVDGTLPDDGGDFQIVQNLAVLLQTMDTDGDPTTDIDISSETAALFNGVSIDIDQTWAEFSTDADLQAVLDKANGQQLFPDTRELRTREDALRALYKGIGLCDDGTGGAGGAGGAGGTGGAGGGAG